MTDQLRNDGLPADEGLPGAPLPEANRPGHHPDVEQDRPPLDEFAARLGLRRDDSRPEAEHEAVDAVARSGAPNAVRRATAGAAGAVGTLRRAVATALRASGRASGAAAEALARLSDRVDPGR